MVEMYRFAGFELDAACLQLRRKGQRIEIEPKPLAVLVALLRNPGELVTKIELMESVWVERVVTDSVLTRCINKLRGILEDRDHTLIRTAHGYGYRYTGIVERVTDPAPTAPSESPSFKPAAGLSVPLRSRWLLLQPLDRSAGIATVWLARHDKTGERRVFKFALHPEQVPALKRDLTIHRLLQHALPERQDYARLLDCNLDTLPFFLELEYCPHGNLAEWLESRGGVAAVPLAERLALLIQAAEALGAAHAIGVLHLDIKPSNLLVAMDTDSRPRIRWTDFGSGRLLDPARLAQLGITRLNATQSHGGDGVTPLYLAPEVISGQPPSVLSDVYALGIVLYQVVAGDLRKPIAPGWEQNVPDELLREDISAAVQGNPDMRLSSAGDLARRLRELEPRRAALAERRAAANQAAILRARLARDRTLRPWRIAAAALLALGLVASLAFYRGAIEARNEARIQAAVTEAVTSFFNDDVLGAASPYTLGGGSDLSVREAVDRAAAGVDHRFAGQPLVEAAIRLRLATFYTQVADLKAAIPQARKATDLYRTHGTLDADAASDSEFLLAALLFFDSRFAAAAEALDALDRNLASRGSVPATLSAHRDAAWASYYRHLEHYEDAIRFGERKYATQLADHPDNILAITISRYTLALDYAHAGRFNDANRLFELALDDLRTADGPGGNVTALARLNYGASLRLEGRHAEAQAQLADAAAVLLKNLGPDDDGTAESHAQLGLLYLETGYPAKATAACRAAYEEYARRFGPVSHFTLKAQGFLGMAELAAGRSTEALRHLRQAHDGLGSLLGAQAPSVQLFGYHLARTYLQDRGKVAEAEALLRRLDAGSLRYTAPRENWNARLDQLSGQLRVAQSRVPEGLEQVHTAASKLPGTGAPSAGVVSSPE